MRLRTLTVLLSLLTLGGTAAAQDAPPTEAGATEAAPTEGGDAMGGDAMGSAEAAPAEAPAEEAPAEEVPVDGDKKPISVGLLLGYGISLEGGGVNPWGLGFGAGGGYTFGFGLYVGGRFVYYLGESSLNVWEVGADVGYAIAMDKLTIRPEMTIGVANMSSPSVTVLGVTVGGGSSTDLYVAPGAVLQYDITDSIYVGADVRLQLIFGPSTVKSLPLLATVGMRF